MFSIYELNNRLIVVFIIVTVCKKVNNPFAFSSVWDNKISIWTNFYSSGIFIRRTPPGVRTKYRLKIRPIRRSVL